MLLKIFIRIKSKRMEYEYLIMIFNLFLFSNE